MIDQAIANLVRYAESTGLIAPEDRTWAVNSLLEVLNLDSWTETPAQEELPSLDQILEEILDDAYARGVLDENSVVYRDLLDTSLMGRLTPPPREVIARFRSLYGESPRKATDWYYDFSLNTNYIRRGRIVKDMRWKTDTPYGELDITINLSKPEKDPKAIAAARNLPLRLPPMPALPQQRGLRGTSESSRPPEPPDDPHHH